MPRKSRRPSPSVYTVDFSDDNRKPFPTLAYDPNLATYVITPLGRVYRDDGRLIPPVTYRLGQLRVKLNGNRYERSVPKAVVQAFGHPELVRRWLDVNDELHRYTAWLPPFGPKDELHGGPRCTVFDVKLVPRKDVTRYGQRGRIPPIQLSIVEPPP